MSTVICNLIELIKKGFSDLKISTIEGIRTFEVIVDNKDSCIPFATQSDSANGEWDANG